MTDRELLEMAAKAGGLEVDCAFTNGDLHVWENRKLQLLRCWNPLVSDEDAFRLAVRLFITVSHDIGMDTVIASFPNYPAAAESAGHNSCAAARRAIVRVAAEIGSRM